jgi:hypothetical protein
MVIAGGWAALAGYATERLFNGEEFNVWDAILNVLTGRFAGKVGAVVCREPVSPQMRAAMEAFDRQGRPNRWNTTVESPSEFRFNLDGDPNTYLNSRLRPDGTLTFEIRSTTPGQGTGSEMFERMLEYYGSRIQQIRGQWIQGAVQGDTNLIRFNATFNQLRQSGMSVANAEVEAARATWTGRRAETAGFGRVQVLHAYEEGGQYVDVEAAFTR